MSAKNKKQNKKYLFLRIIIGGFLILTLGVFLWLVFFNSQIYRLTRILKMPTLGIGEKLDSAENLKYKIDSGFYDQQIIEGLNLPGQSKLGLMAEVSRGCEYLQVCVNVSAKDKAMGQSILNELIRQIQNQFQPIIALKTEEIMGAIVLTDNMGAIVLTDKQIQDLLDYKDGFQTRIDQVFSQVQSLKDYLNNFNILYLKWIDI